MTHADAQYIIALLGVIVFLLLVSPLAFQFVMNGLLDRFDRILRTHLYDMFGRKH